MTSADLNRSLPALVGELIHDAPEAGAFMLNPAGGDFGTIRQVNPAARGPKAND